MSNRHDAQRLAPLVQASQGGTMTDKKVWFVTGAGRGVAPQGSVFRRHRLSPPDSGVAVPCVSPVEEAP